MPPQKIERAAMMQIHTLRRRLWSTFSDISGSTLVSFAEDLTWLIINSQIVCNDQFFNIDLLNLSIVWVFLPGVDAAKRLISNGKE